MMVRTSLCLVLPLVLCATGSSQSHAEPARAETAPIAVSPGNPAEALPVEARCPAFSWAISPAAESYDLVVYELGTTGEEPALRLRQHIPAPVGSWTPDLTRCLERGLRYAWSVRAVSAAALSPWSSPRLFTVAEIGELEPLRLRAGVDPLRRPQARAEPEARDRRRPTAQGESADLSGAEARPARIGSAGTIPNKLTVSGAVSADLFNGSGSGLINVDADTVDGLDANAFALAAHDHDASQIGSGILADARIPVGIARDAEVAAAYLPTIGGSVGGVSAWGRGRSRAGSTSRSRTSSSPRALCSETT